MHEGTNLQSVSDPRLIVVDVYSWQREHSFFYGAQKTQEFALIEIIR